MTTLKELSKQEEEPALNQLSTEQLDAVIGGGMFEAVTHALSAALTVLNGGPSGVAPKSTWL